MEAPSIGKITPMQRQYQELKVEYPDAILFFRLGDFYEMFGPDALEASLILGITLTTRDRQSPDPLPMCGVPFHAAENYLAKLTKAGKKVAIAEQVSDPRLPGLVKREVIRVITPGTTFSEQVLEAKEHQFVGAICEKSSRFGVAFADLSTGEFATFEADDWGSLLEELKRLAPKEVVLPQHLFSREDIRRHFPVISQEFLPKDPHRFLTTHFGTKTLKGFGLGEDSLCVDAAALLLRFLKATQKGEVSHLKGIRVENRKDFMPLDPETIKNLEILYDAEGGKEGSLLSILDETRTPMGGRKLRQTLLRPLQNRKKIEDRLEAVGELTERPEVVEKLKEQLKEIADLERLIAKIACNRAVPRDLLALKRSLQKLPELAALLGTMKSKRLKALAEILAKE